MTLDQLNALPADDARSEFLRCCGSKSWANEMARRRPFSTKAELLRIAAEVWNNLESDDWKEAFSHHPKIGDLTRLGEKFAGTRQFGATARMASEEQSGVLAASDENLRQLADGNRLYEEKYGYIFIVCATGKNAAEMLGYLHERMNNDPSAEILVAAGEQARITELRLKKLCP